MDGGPNTKATAQSLEPATQHNTTPALELNLTKISAAPSCCWSPMICECVTRRRDRRRPLLRHCACGFASTVQCLNRVRKRRASRTHHGEKKFKRSGVENVCFNVLVSEGDNPKATFHRVS